MDELLHQFLIECREVVQQVSEDLVALEKEPDSIDLLDSVFRGFHTLKGSSALFDFAPLTGMLHTAEDLLSQVRAGRAAAEGALAAALLAAAAQTEDWLEVIERTGALPADAQAGAVAVQARLLHTASQAEPPTAEAAREGLEWAEELRAELGDPPGALTAMRYTPDAGAYFRGDDPVAALRGVPGLLGVKVRAREAFGDLAAYDPYQCNLVLLALSSAPAPDVRAALRLVAPEVEFAAVTPHAQQQDVIAERARAGVRSLRIDAGRIDALAAIVDELVIAKNSLGLLAVDARRSEGAEALGRNLTEAQAGIDRLVGRLHTAVTRVRLVPLSPLFARFPRAVRETAAALDKQVELVLRGEEVEVDKAIVDGLYEPLLHLVRNAIDHGVEAAGDRAAAGKPPRAVVTLSARPAGDHVLIEVSDDGRGIDPEKTRRAAVERGLVTAEAARRLNDDEALNLVFATGFSTASRVSQLSGRGVGMDAVRTAAARMGGRVSIQSTVGAGSTVRLALPVSVVLTKVMVVRAGAQRFGLPLEMIAETTKVAPERITSIRAGEAFLLRDEPVPLLHLQDLLGIPRPVDEAERKVVIMRTESGVVGLAVDEFSGRMDVPLRPMTGLLAGMPGVTGTTLLGDGQVLMVLNVGELIG